MLKGEIGTIWSTGDFDVVFAEFPYRATCFRASVEVDFEVTPAASVLARVAADAPARIIEIRAADARPEAGRTRLKGVIATLQGHFARA